MQMIKNSLLTLHPVIIRNLPGCHGAFSVSFSHWSSLTVWTHLIRADLTPPFDWITKVHDELSAFHTAFIEQRLHKPLKRHLREMEQLNIRKLDEDSFELVIVPTTSKQLCGRPARAFANLEFNFNIARSQISHRTSSESCWGDWEASGNSSGSHSRILTLESIRCFWLRHFQPWMLNSLGCRWRTSFYPWHKLTRKLANVRKSF